MGEAMAGRREGRKDGRNGRREGARELTGDLARERETEPCNRDEGRTCGVAWRRGFAGGTDSTQHQAKP